MSDERSAIERLYAASATALKARDIVALSSFYTDDAIQFPPASPPLEGWEAIRASLENELASVALDVAVDVSEVVIAGEWAFARGRYRIAVLDEAGGEGEVTEGSWLDVLKRQGGRWRIARSAWSQYA